MSQRIRFIDSSGSAHLAVGHRALGPGVGEAVALLALLDDLVPAGPDCEAGRVSVLLTRATRKFGGVRCGREREGGAG